MLQSLFYLTGSLVFLTCLFSFGKYAYDFYITKRDREQLEETRGLVKAMLEGVNDPAVKAKAFAAVEGANSIAALNKMRDRIQEIRKGASNG